MKTLLSYLVAFLLLLSFQCTAQRTNKNEYIFIGTTPCDQKVKSLLNVQEAEKCDMMKWKIVIERNSTTTTYTLNCQYGMSKQNSHGFMEGSKNIELRGTLDRDSANSIFTLKPGNGGIILSFYYPDKNHLHLLDREKHLIVGNGGFSYTLNRIDPTTDPPVNLNLKPASLHKENHSSIYGAFTGRTPCDQMIESFNDIDSSRCQIIKWRMTLYQDSINHTPFTFKLETLYVGIGNNSHVNTGKWMVNRGMKHNREIIIYTLVLDPSRPAASFNFLNVDDNNLFMLDKNNNLKVGNDYVSYTLSRMH